MAPPHALSPSTTMASHTNRFMPHLLRVGILVTDSGGPGLGSEGARSEEEPPFRGALLSFRRPSVSKNW